LAESRHNAREAMCSDLFMSMTRMLSETPQNFAEKAASRIASKLP